MCVGQILQENNRFRQNTAGLRAMSKYYPVIVRDTYDGAVFLTTLVRIERGEKWYTVHCVESFEATEPSDFTESLEMMMMKAHDIQHLYLITGTMEDVDVLQISEKERLVNEKSMAFNR